MTENTVTTDKIICPNCGNQHTIFEDYALDAGEITCNECSHRYYFNTAKTTIYTTKLLPTGKKYVLELPEPLTETPINRTEYWTPDFEFNSGHPVFCGTWDDTSFDQFYFDLGLCFATEADAQAFIDALKNRQPATE